MNPPTPVPAPNPYDTAKAQAESNVKTATAQTGLNAINQVTPYGSLSYRQIGTWDDGTPRFEATQSLSPSEQGLFDIGNKTRTNLANIGAEQSANVRNLLNTPLSLDNSAVEGRLAELGRARLDPQFAQQQSALETQLINKGVRPGSAAYDQALQQFNQSKNDAYNQLYLTGRQQAVGELLQQRQEPLNEISALLSGSQVSQPNWIKTPTSGVAPTDFLGAQGQALNQSNVGFNAANANNQAMMAGLFGLGKTALGGWMGGGFG